MPHSAVLLAGGKSSRMGRDKAGLLVEGVPLWKRQLATLGGTAPVEVFISSVQEETFSQSGVKVVADVWAEAGPLGGIASVLPRCTVPWLLVLAVDMPRMTADFLRGMVEQAEHVGKGVVPRHDDGKWEPLAGVYPAGASAIAEDLLRGGRRKMEEWIAELERRGMLMRREVEEGERGLFENWNEPGDVRGVR